MADGTATEAVIKTHSRNRRSFLALTALAGGGLLLAVYPEARAQNPFADVPLSPLDFLSIDSDGKVTIAARNPELGQGTLNTRPMLVPEELGEAERPEGLQDHRDPDDRR